ncbi:unnamed protein product [Mytilus coruscus]|uniref:Uncharacterized protein n=1 Tax=Mytilus coruscus TaxID=42192 RepID=A0A6J8APJ3_MYTCO|nr:unnamed protein product [Mytilus coruscus]
MTLDLVVRVSATEDMNSYNELSNSYFRAHMRYLNQQQIQFIYNVVHQIKTNDKPSPLGGPREGNHTSKDIVLLKTQCIEEGNENHPHDTPHVFFSNKKVNEHNATIFQKIKSVKTTVKAKDRLVGNYKAEVSSKILESFQNNSKDVSQLSTILEVAEGLTYEMTLNLDCEDGLINGAACSVKKIK